MAATFTITSTFNGALKISLPHQWIWDLRVLPTNSLLVADKDYAADLETGEITRLPNGRVSLNAVLLATYSTVLGTVANEPVLIGPSGGVLATYPIESLELRSIEPLPYQRAIAGDAGDYFADLEKGELVWVPSGRIPVADELAISYSCFGRNVPEDPEAIDLSGFYATPADFVRAIGLKETTRLTQNGNGEGRDYATEPDWAKLSIHLEHATAVIDSAAGPYLEWNAVGGSTPEFDSRQWIAISFARYHLDPQQGQDIWTQAELALSRLRDKGKGGGVIPPEFGTGLDSRYISYGAVPQTFTQRRLEGWQ
jgi:hypothetical protein